MLLNPFNKTPKVICTTPKITDNFIFNEFMIDNSFEAIIHAGSTPKS